MTTRFEKERTKQIQDKCQNLLSQMLRDEDNKYCVDCDAKGPRWASWNLGIFLCIRCAGIHRNLGVHISKVKSVNLDTWTPEQVVSLQQMGNSRARAVYEANLPNAFRRPQTDCSLESFIRAKYEHKKYIAREWVPSPIPKVNWDKELDEEAEKLRKKKKEGLKTNVNQNTLPPVKKPEVVPQLPKPQSSASPRPSRVSNISGGSSSSSSNNSNSNSATLDLLGLDTPATGAIQANGLSSNDDIFSSFLSATPATLAPAGASNSTVDTSGSTSGASKADEESFFNQPAPTPQEKSKMTKDSILALYGTQNQQQSVFGLPSGGLYNQQQTLQNVFSQPIQNVSTFGQQNTFISQNSLGQMNQLPAQMVVPINNQMNLNPNQMGIMTSNIQMGPINQINSLPNQAMAMQTPMMLQMGQSNIASNNTSWNGMLAGQSIQPAPGSNPFFNLPTSTNPAFPPPLSQQMSQLSLDGLGKPTPAGETLSTNLWQ